MLSNTYYPGFQLDRSVVHHELGHAFVWINEGGIVDRIYFWRTSDNSLAGGMRQGLPQLGPGETEPILCRRMWTEQGPQLARRFLAGEAAARRYLNLPEHEIFYEFADNDNCNLMALLPDAEQGSPDIVKALNLARDHAGIEWLEWIACRHRESRRLIENHWDRLTTYALNIVQRLPELPGAQLVIASDELNNALRL